MSTRSNNYFDPIKNSQQTKDYYERLNEYIEGSDVGGLTQLRNFSKYVPRQTLTEFLVRYELFKCALDVAGSIVECGVLHGQGLMTFAQLSSILEPTHYVRKVIGFDTFEGFPEPSDRDQASKSPLMRKSAFRADSFEDIMEAVSLFDQNRFLGHIPKVDLVRGKVETTVPAYIERNPYLIVALLYLDLDLFEPTKCALEHLVERIPKGGIIAFDEINNDQWPGESIALLETVGVKNLRLKRFPFDARISYAVLD